MNVSSDTLGTPPGGAIILGRLEGIPLLVELADAIVVVSWMMLLPTKNDVALSVVIGRIEWIGVAVDVADRVIGVPMLAELDADEVMIGVADAVVEGTTADDRIEREADSLADAFSDVEGVSVALLEALDEEVEAIDSEAGMLKDPLDEAVALEDRPDEAAVPVENRPDEVAVPVEDRPDEAAVPVDRVNVGRMPDDADSVELPVAVGVAETLPLAEALPLADADSEGTIPDDCRLEEKSDKMLEAMLLSSEVGNGSGIEAVGRGELVAAEERADSALDTRLDTMLGRADPDKGRSDTADESRLERSEITVEARGGRIPEAVGEGVIEAGAVGLAAPELGRTPDGSWEPDGSTPVTSETTDDRIEDRLMRPELAEDPSEVGMAPDADAVAEAVDPVPKAVVMPTTIPLDEGVGLSRSEESRPPTRPALADEVGRTIVSGMPPVDPATPPVDPGTMKGPSMDEGAFDGATEETAEAVAEAVGETITLGRVPVGTTCDEAVWVGSLRSDESRPPTRPALADEVGRTIVSGMPPVDPATPPVDPGTMKGPSMDEGALEGATEEAAEAVGETITLGKTPVGATLEEIAWVGWIMAEEAPPVPPSRPPRREESRPPVGWADWLEGDSVGLTSGEALAVEAAAEEVG
jgi:hypothetical protein